MKIFYTLLLVLFVQFSYSQIRFQNIPRDARFPERTLSQTIVADTPYQGYDETQPYLGQGEYQIFLDNVNGVLDKPIIILDGFDPGNSRGISDIYASLGFGGQNFADVLRNEGFDIVILNAPIYTTNGKTIDGGADYIQRNAMVLTALIQKLNTDKIGEEELVVLGPSMGGLIARYALSYMESNSLNPQTRLFISFDAPHRGANIPISLQYVINYFAEEVGDAGAQEVIDQLLKSPAAKEMLVDHLEGHLLSGSTYEQDPSKILPLGAPGFRNEFQTELDALGFPQNVRNVAISNGSVNGVTTGSPGMTIIDTNLTIDATTSVDVALKFTPEAAQTNTATNITLKFFGIPISTYQTLSKSPNYTDGVDSAPGGTGSISDALGDGGGNPVLIEFINALQQELYCFIPTMSSLAIDNPDWFATPNLSDSPFVAFSVPAQNEPHVAMDADNVQFALDEIRNGAMGIPESKIGEGYVLVQNPVGEKIDIAILGNDSQENLTATVFGITGQKLMVKTWTHPQQKLSFDHNLESGIYLLKLDNGRSVQTIKMVVE
ncbi:T9SS type A sorting domain-containing protein [Aequorivita sp. H23M31]|uniref:T9SS type A sorting domain-containing protein n=1 Tax=Aequorivita ciconiae TaxID=2494375 RepID=A0A410FZK5_9FLAO|nr:T9SS type A sorting domain-containing protein [Aequorivita sp. H23M31]QAA80429.1 T9SS type A sorting domain-containing protein [Aequorivita sp. H23M31]